MATMECRSTASMVLCIAILATTMLFGAAGAQAYQTAPGWVASDYATDLPYKGIAGPLGLAFDRSGNMLVTDAAEAALYKFAPGGGPASGAKLRDGYGHAAGLAFDKSGRLFMARWLEQDIVEINPANGEIVRTVVGGLPCPVGLATDPISGDLFVSNTFCDGGGIMRISGFANGGGTATVYAGGQDADGIAFAPDGTLFAAAIDRVVRIAGTNSSTPGAVSDLAVVPSVDGIAYSPAGADAEYLVVVRNDGEIDRVDVDGRVTPVLTGASRGDLATVGPDRCIYADLQDRVIKLGPASGSCLFAAPVQPGTSPGGSGSGPGGGTPLRQDAAKRLVDTAVQASAPKSVKLRRSFTLKLKATNKSTTAAQAVVVTDTMPRGVRLASAHAVKGVKCSQKGRRLTCRKSRLARGTSFTARFVVRGVSGRAYTNRVRVRSQDLDPVPGNNDASSTTLVRRGR
jgi:sugar lactone lactonase YvrE